MSYGQSDFNDWKEDGDKGEEEFSSLMKLRNKPVNNFNQIDRRVDFVSQRNPHIFYEPKVIKKFPPEYLINHLCMKFPIALDVGKIHHYENFITEDPSRQLYIIIKLQYPKEAYASTRNGWYYISAKDLVPIFKRTSHRTYERQLREDEKKTGKVNKIKWHIEHHELTPLKDFEKPAK